MKKRWLAILCAAFLLMTGCVPAALADSGPYYPVSVEEYAGGSPDTMRVRKVYQLSLSDDPAKIPKDDFERGGHLYQFLEMTEQNEIGLDRRECEQSVTKDSDTAEMSEILKGLDAELPVKTEDGYEGTLLLDHTSVTVRAKGYDSETENLSANRKYADLPDANLSLIPKSVNEDGKILTLTNVQWSSGEDGEGNPRFSASATYSGTSTTRRATGYTVTANYVGRVAKTNCDIVTYTLTFAGTPVPPPAPEAEPEESVTETEDETITEGETETPFPTLRDVLSILGCIGGAAALGGAALCVVEEKSKKGKRTITNES